MANSKPTVQIQNQHSGRTLEPRYQLTQHLLRSSGGAHPGNQTIADRLGHGKTDDALTESCQGHGSYCAVAIRCSDLLHHRTIEKFRLGSWTRDGPSATR